MATLEQANTYNSVRGNDDWSELVDEAPQQAVALLQDAEDYIRSTYPVRPALTAEEQRIFDGIVCRLAAVFQANPPQIASSAAVKSEKKEGAGFKKETEYFEAGADPYPYVTAVIRPFLQVASGKGVYMGVVTG